LGTSGYSKIIAKKSQIFALSHKKDAEDN